MNIISKRASRALHRRNEGSFPLSETLGCARILQIQKEDDASLATFRAALERSRELLDQMFA
jgi:hypothetical protein